MKEAKEKFCPLCGVEYSGTHECSSQMRIKRQNTLNWALVKLLITETIETSFLVYFFGLVGFLAALILLPINLIVIGLTTEPFKLQYTKGSNRDWKVAPKVKRVDKKQEEKDNAENEEEEDMMVELDTMGEF